MSKTAEVAEAQKTEVSTNVINYAEDTGAGFQEARPDSYSLPFFYILQAMSKVTKKSEGAYIAGAQEGMFINSSTSTLYDGASGVAVVPCHFEQRIVERKTKENGGDFVARHTIDSGLMDQAKVDAKGRYVLPNGNEISDVRTHYCLLLPDYPKSNRTIPIVVSMSSTQRRKSKRWMSLMQGAQIETPNGPVPAPMFSKIYRLRSVAERNDQGSWWGWHIEPEGTVTDPQLYSQAKAFNAAVRQGQAKAPTNEADHGVDDAF